MFVPTTTVRIHLATLRRSATAILVHFQAAAAVRSVVAVELEAPAAVYVWEEDDNWET